MNVRRWPLCGLILAAVATGGTAVASPAWAATAEEQGCHLTAKKPVRHGSALRGTGGRAQCADTVTYFWVRVYRVIDLWPDAERAVTGRQYVQNTEITATGKCDGPGDHYTHTSTATGLDGDSLESGREPLC